jgi:hypothetical protein
MSDERHKQQDDVPSGDDKAPLRALESAESYVAASAKAGCSGDGSGASFSASFEAILSWGEANALIQPEGEFAFFKRAPDGAGDEHQAWFDEVSNRWFKATYCNQFGLAWGRRGSATAGEYLTRLVLQNRYFGDDLQLVALVSSRQKLRVLTSQPHVAGEAAAYEDIQKWFCGLGFLRVEDGGSCAWYREPENLLVADAHEGNVIQTGAGALVPIDLNIVQPSGEVLAWLVSVLGGSGAATASGAAGSA